MRLSVLLLLSSLLSKCVSRVIVPLGRHYLDSASIELGRHCTEMNVDAAESSGEFYADLRLDHVVDQAAFRAALYI